MTQHTNLTNNQTKVLKSAAARADRSIEPLPIPLMGGAKTAMINSLIQKGFAEYHNDEPKITNKGLAFFGESTSRVFDNTSTSTATPKEPTSDLSENTNNKNIEQPKPKKKKEILLELIERPKGASLKELCEAVNWEKHSVRGSISQLKAQGHNIKSANIDGERTYTIDTEAEDKLS